MTRGDGATVYRAAEPEDLAAVESLLRGAELPLAGVAGSLRGFVVAESPDGLVGVAGLEVHGRDGVLRSVAVERSVRDRGVGRELTERVLASARAAGLRRVYLLTTTADRYFRRWGFQPIPREAASPEVQENVEFREACPASAVAMVLDLSASSSVAR